jgi:succinate dehydrogenase/fumarate reductase-like Fe-S protein
MLYNYKEKSNIRNGGNCLKRLEGFAAELIKDIIHDGESVIEIDGKKYQLTLIEEPETTVKEDVESDPELKQKLLQAKKDILDGKVYSTDDVLEMIDQGRL